MWEYLPSYDHYTLGLVIQFIIAGMFAALVRISWLNKPLRGFYRDEKGHLHMGFFAELFTAVAVALIVNHHPINALLFAVFAPFILDLIRNVLTSNALVEILLRSQNKQNKPPN